MTAEIVMSPVNDPDFKTHLNDSPVWKNCYHVEEVTDEIRKKYNKWFEYHVKFSGITPIQCVKIKEV